LETQPAEEKNELLARLDELEPGCHWDQVSVDDATKAIRQTWLEVAKEAIDSGVAVDPDEEELVECRVCAYPSTADERFVIGDGGEVVCNGDDCIQVVFDDYREEIAKLRAFKDYVHGRLDEAGIPTHPEGPHSAEGCRIGDRLDLVFSERKNLRRALRRCADMLNCVRLRCGFLGESNQGKVLVGVEEEIVAAGEALSGEDTKRDDHANPSDLLLLAEIAIRDAIRRPMGVEPESAEKFFAELKRKGDA